MVSGAVRGWCGWPAAGVSEAATSDAVARARTIHRLRMVVEFSAPRTSTCRDVGPRLLDGGERAGRPAAVGELLDGPPLAGLHGELLHQGDGRGVLGAGARLDH